MTESAVPVVVQVILAILGVAVTLLGGIFMVLWNSIGKLRDDVRQDIDHMNEAIEAKAGEHRQGQQQLWSEFRLAEGRANEYRARVEGQLGRLPTRDDMKAARDEMREDLKAMEKRITEGMVHNAHR